MGVSILVADDDELLRNLLKDVFEEEGFQVYEARDGEEAVNIFWKHSEISLVILDIMMPKLDGMEVLSEIRSVSDAPILMLTALGDAASELNCLKSGASDFVSKPFHYEILIERVKILLTLSKIEYKNIKNIGILSIDYARHKIFIKDKEISLNHKEFQLLDFLVQNKGIVLTREKILDRIWGYDYDGDIRTIDTHIKMLRSNLGEAANYIKTVRGTGYLFEEIQ